MTNNDAYQRLRELTSKPSLADIHHTHRGDVAAVLDELAELRDRLTKLETFGEVNDPSFGDKPIDMVREAERLAVVQSQSFYQYGHLTDKETRIRVGANAVARFLAPYLHELKQCGIPTESIANVAIDELRERIATARERDELRARLTKLEAAARRAYEFYSCEDGCECDGCEIGRELYVLLPKSP